jgi:site-specific recombinase XerD
MSDSYKRSKGVPTSLRGEVCAVVADLARSGEVSGLRIPCYQLEFEVFVAHMARLHHAQHLRDVTAAQAESFVTYPRVGPEGVRPAALTTTWQRRSTVRLLYRVARRLGLADSDPTLDVKLQPRAARSTRPLTNDEIPLGRSYAVSGLRETQAPAAWALAEATATTIECACILISDVDLGRGRVWIHGTARRVPRWVALTAWGAEQLDRRLHTLCRRGIEDGPLLALNAKNKMTAANAAQISITCALTRSGLNDDPAVRPASVAAWRGAHEFFDKKATLDQVAKLLGVRKLDSAASIIGYEWRGTRGQ